MGGKTKPSSAGKPLMGYDEIVIQEDDSKCCSCTPSWVKTFLIFFTAIILFAWILFIILLIQFTTGILALCFSNILTEWLADRLMLTMQTLYFRDTDGVDAAVDHIQQKFKCCGSRSYRDWTDSIFQNYSKRNEILPYPNYQLVVPDSCCVRSVKSCGTLPHPSNVYNEGCMESILFNLREQYYIICVVVLALVFVEVSYILTCTILDFSSSA
uniref:CD151 antigen n=1 Tax=Schistosoma haematobium TaxID=6185 RepID=A0A094ZKG6_SCHHA